MGAQCDPEHHERGVPGLRVSVQEGQGLKTDCSVLSWVGLALGHVGKMLYIPCHEYTCAETHPHSPVHVEAHLNERVLSQHSPWTLPPFPCLGAGGGGCRPRQLLAPSEFPTS